MNGLTKRLCISLVCPPLLASVFTSCYLLVLSSSRNTPWYASLDNVAGAFLFTTIYGFIICTPLSLIYWLICELIWALNWHILKTRFVFSFIGGSLGLLAGYGIIAFMIGQNAGPTELILMCASGAIAGFATSWIVYPQYDKIA